MDPTPAPAKSAKHELESIFPGYRELANLHQWLAEVRQRIAGLTEELAGARREPPSQFQTNQIHQFNNALHRAGYEQEKVLEKYRGSLKDRAEEVSVEWLRLKSVWSGGPEQTFQLQVIQAKCAYLLQARDLLATETTPALGVVQELEAEIDHFANSHLPPGALFDDPLGHFSHLIERIGVMLVAAYNEAAEPPAWRSTLENPGPGELSLATLEAASQRISEEIDQISHHIRERRLELPAGIWREGNDLRPEIHAFALLLHPDHPLHHIDIPETLRYLDDDPSSTLRRTRLASLKQDDTRAKKWLETHAQHARLIEKSAALSLEGNYRRGLQMLGQTPPLFSDLDYNSVERQAERWKRDLAETDRRLSQPMDQAQGLLQRAFRRFWFGFGPARAARVLLSKIPTGIAEKARTLPPLRGTDFYQDMDLLLGRLRGRLEQLIRLHRKAERFLQLVSLASVAGFIAMTVLASGLALQALRVQRGTLTVTVKPLLPGEMPPTIFLSGEMATGPNAVFRHLHSGTYRLNVMAAEYEPYSQRIEILPAEQRRLPVIELQPKSGTLRLQAREEGYQYEVHKADDPAAAVAASGALHSADAVHLRLRPGRYALHVTQGKKTYTTVVEVPLHEVASYTPDFQFSRVRIDSKPQGAVVSLNGSDFGFTPLDVSLPPIAQSVALSLNGYETYYLPVKPQEGAPLSIQVTLTKVRPKPNPPPPDNTSIPPQVPFPAEGLDTP